MTTIAHRLRSKYTIALLVVKYTDCYCARSTGIFISLTAYVLTCVYMLDVVTILSTVIQCSLHRMNDQHVVQRPGVCFYCYR